MRLILILVLTVAACAPPETRPDGSPTWLTEEFLTTLPGSQPAAFVVHARAAVFQTQGPTYVDDWLDEDLVALAALWCADGANVHHETIGDEMERQGFDLNPGRDFLPVAPIDELITRVADIHAETLCASV